jgi:hypothetical protein
MSNELGLSLILGPPMIIVALVVTFRVLGPGHPAPAASDAELVEMSPARLGIAQSVATGMLTHERVPDKSTLAEVMALKDQRRPATAVKLLRERTGLGLGDAKRLVDRLP